ncbi:MAG: glycosyltransferase family 2 protein [bacterium]
MKISIIIPAHNEEASIEAVVKAALKQDYPDFEIIVVDNCSTDRTAEIVKNMGVKVVSETRKGTQWAREKGRTEANGDIIANLDADCLSDSNWLQKGVKHFSSKKVVAVTGPYDYYDGDKFFRKFSLVFQKCAYTISNYILQKIHKGAVTIGGNVFLRANILEKIGGYNTNILFYGDDTDTAKRMAKEGTIIFDRNLIMKTSARRLKSQGSIKTSVIYIYHFFKVIFRA